MIGQPNWSSKPKLLKIESRGVLNENNDLMYLAILEVGCHGCLAFIGLCPKCGLLSRPNICNWPMCSERNKHVGLIFVAILQSCVMALWTAIL